MIDFFLIFFKCRLRCPSAFLRQASRYRVLPIVNFRLPGPYSLGGLTAASAGADPSEMAETRKPAVHPSAKGGRQDSGARNFKPTGSFPSRRNLHVADAHPALTTPRSDHPHLFHQKSSVFVDGHPLV